MNETAGVQQEQQPAESASRWEDYVDVFFSPAELFRRRATDRVGPPLITLLVLSVIFYIVLIPSSTMIMRAAVAENPDAAEAMSRFQGIAQVAGAITVPITYLVMLAFAAVVLLVVGRLMDVRTQFSRTMLIATYSGFVLLLSQLVVGVLLLVHGEAGLDPVRDTSVGLLRFTGDDGMARALVPLLRRLDLFAIWQAVIWGVGIYVIGRTTRVQAALTAALSWLLIALPGLVTAALGIGQQVQT